jgi:hypothetical protein
MPNSEVGTRAKQLVARLLDAITDADGTSALPGEVVTELVHADPEAAAAAVPALLKVATMNRGFYQIAQAVAGAYEFETHDDSLTKMVDAVVSKLDTPLKKIRFLDPSAPSGTPPADQLPDEPKVGVIAVNPADLAKGDVFPIVRLFRIDEATIDPPLTRSLRGRVLLTFPVDDDPRPVWMIPSVRTHQQKLFAQVPYFPYYLDPTPELAMFLTFFGPLADLTAISADGVDLGNPSVVDRVVSSMRAVGRIARLVGEQPVEVCQSILKPLPDDYVAEILARAKL